MEGKSVEDEPTYLIVSMKDKKGNLIEGNEKMVVAKVTDKDGHVIETNTEQVDEGTKVSFVPKGISPLTATVQINGTDVTGSPFEVTVKPSLNAKNCSVEGKI